MAPEIGPEESRAPTGGSEATLEREIGQAFESAFGGGSAAAQASSSARAAPPDDEPSALEPAQGVADAAEGITDWYVAIDDNQVGPLHARDVKSRWESGEVGPDTLAWRPGMADWVAISTIPEMAQYLAPVPRADAGGSAADSQVETTSTDFAAEPRAAAPVAAPTPVAAAAPAPDAPVNGAAANQDTAWKPSAGSALAALANEEIASLEGGEQQKAPAPPEARPGGGSLVDKMELPDGGVDPTNLLPLHIKGLESTGESALKARPEPAVRGETSEIRRIKKSATRSIIAVAAAMVLLFAAGIGVVVWLLRPSHDERRQAPIAAAPARPPAPPAVASADPVKPPPVAPAPVAAAPAEAPKPAAPPAPAAAPATAATPPAATPAPAAHPMPAPVPGRERVAKRPPEPPLPARTTKKARERIASAEPSAPAAQPARRGGGDPLLDVGDDDIDKELSGKGSKRSVYVPPALGGGGDLPDRVSVSQINEAVVGQKTALVRCIEQQKAADPDTRGTLRVRWMITGEGGVRDVRVLSDEFKSQPIAPCISGVVRGIRFPKSRTKGQEVVFPFKF